MSVEVHWHEMPKELRKVVEPLVDKWLHLLPTWCVCLAIRYGEAKDEGNVGEMETEVNYRQAKLRICRRFLEDSDANRERTIIHEFLHVPIAPIQRFMAHVMALYMDESDFGAWQQQFDEEVIEGVVQDLTYSLLPPNAGN